MIAIPAGATTATVEVQVTGDAVAEAPVRYRLALSPDFPMVTGTESWQEQARLYGPGERSRTSFHGTSAAVSGDLMAVGSPAYGENAGHGAVLVYRRDAAAPQGWLLEAFLEPGSGHSRHRFGTYVALDGDTLMAGTAPETLAADQPPAELFIYRRERSGSLIHWREVRRMVFDESFDTELYAVAIRNNDAIVSAGGGLHFLSRHFGGENNWGVSTFFPTPEEPKFRAAVIGKGFAVAQTLDFRREPSRYLTVFERTEAGGWAVAEAIDAPDGGVPDFGLLLACSGTEIAAFAGAVIGGIGSQDSALIYRREEAPGNGGSWRLAGRVEPKAQIGGFSLDGDNFLAAVGDARLPPTAALFTRKPDDAWARAATIPRGGDAPVRSVSLSGSRLVVASQPVQVFDFLSELTIRVEDDDGAPVLDLPVIRVDESTPTAEIRLQLSSPASRALTVSYRTEDGGTALAQADYSPVTGLVEIPPGGDNATISVPIINDGKPEQTEQFHVEIDGAGFSLSAAIVTVIVVDDDPLPALVPAVGVHRLRVPQSPGEDPLWITPEFDDSSWKTGTGGIGYERSGNDYAALITSDVGDMFGTSGSMFARYAFDIDAEAAAIPGTLFLRVRYDDGFSAWLNGEPVASRNAPAIPRWNSIASTSHPDDMAVQPETITLPIRAIVALRPGKNVLAIQGLNAELQSSDFLLIPEVIVRPIDPETDPAINWLSVRTGSVPLSSALFTDADGDGLDGLAEYALQSDPARPDPAPLTISAQSSAATLFHFVFPDPIPPGISYTIEASPDLSVLGWIPIAEKLPGLPWAELREDVSLSLRQTDRHSVLVSGEWRNLSNDAQWFLRLRVSTGRD